MKAQCVVMKDSPWAPENLLPMCNQTQASLPSLQADAAWEATGFGKPFLGSGIALTAPYFEVSHNISFGKGVYF